MEATQNRGHNSPKPQAKGVPFSRTERNRSVVGKGDSPSRRGDMPANRQDTRQKEEGSEPSILRSNPEVLGSSSDWVDSDYGLDL